jgi:putative membrane protein
MRNGSHAQQQERYCLGWQKGWTLPPMHDLYPYYDLCGRLFPSISALNDQHIGGIVSWLPPAMMSVIGLLVVLNAVRVHEEAATEVTKDDTCSSRAVLASRWTGR